MSALSSWGITSFFLLSSGMVFSRIFKMSNGSPERSKGIFCVISIGLECHPLGSVIVFTTKWIEKVMAHNLATNR